MLFKSGATIGGTNSGRPREALLQGLSAASETANAKESKNP